MRAYEILLLLLNVAVFALWIFRVISWARRGAKFPRWIHGMAAGLVVFDIVVINMAYRPQLTWDVGERKEIPMVDSQCPDDYSGQTTDELIALEGKCDASSLVYMFVQALIRKVDHIGLARLTEEERVVLAVEALECEVNNGGYFQFFFNPSKEYTPIIVDSLQRIGCADAARLTQRAIDALEIEGSVTVKAIDRAMIGENDKRNTKLDACDEYYYKVIGGMSDPVFDFIKANRAKITLLPG